jgi:ppGpp synthetase/RelA/SpoT-type nucleotidyltranferase
MSVVADTKLPFSRHDFDVWYDRLLDARLRPATSSVADAITAKLDQELPEYDRARFQVLDGEIKEASRVWHEINRPERLRQIVILDDIMQVCGDLVSVRIVCNNLTDVTILSAIFASIPLWNGVGVVTRDHPVLLRQDSVLDYLHQPRESGYRGYHIGVFVSPRDLESRTPVLCEVQVRTLLQDAWGRLTQEDTYGPGLDLPDAVRLQARRMADLLAVVDDLAQDIRDELEALVHRALDEEPETLTSAADPTDHPNAALSQAVLAETTRIVNRLRKRTPLATIAFRLLRIFGQSLTPNWSGYGSFKLLLSAALPTGYYIDSEPPGYVVPGTRPAVPRVGVGDPGDAYSAAAPPTPRGAETVIPPYSGFRPWGQPEPEPSSTGGDEENRNAAEPPPAVGERRVYPELPRTSWTPAPPLSPADDAAWPNDGHDSSGATAPPASPLPLLPEQTPVLLEEPAPSQIPPADVDPSLEEREVTASPEPSPPLAPPLAGPAGRKQRRWRWSWPRRWRWSWPRRPQG